ncbi:MAG: prolyl oligopeptidase family serine peptidase [Rhodoferax sp.]|jgi:predicted peptidase|nr:prolyl oligopeptidase family serine peptidase [Rhodoferax sp.]
MAANMNGWRWLLSLAAVTALMGGCAMHTPWNLAPGQHAQTFDGADEPTLKTRFLLFLPQGYGQEAGKKWPLMVFLHGSGERGDDITQVKKHGPPKLLDQQPDFPFIVVSPQAAANSDWSSASVNALIDQLIQQLAVDVSRIYLTGLSRGGHGTWAIAADRPERFAAIAPVCGAGDPAKACSLKAVPVWAFHGAEDKVVSLASDARMVDAVRACGGDVKFTVYPGVGHDSWTPTYANPALYAWLLQHSLASRPR